MIDKTTLKTQRKITFSDCVNIYRKIICNGYNGLSTYGMNASNDEKKISILCEGKYGKADWRIRYEKDAYEGQRIDNIAQNEIESMMAHKTSRTLPFTTLGLPFVMSMFINIERKDGVYQVRLQADREAEGIARELEKLIL